MRRFLRLSALLSTLLLVIGTGDASTYIIRYKGSDPLPEFLSRNGLVLRKAIPGQPVFQVQDVLKRPPAEVLQDVDEDEEDAHIEVDQRVFLPEVVVRRSLVSDLRPLRDTLRNRKLSPYYGTWAPSGYASQPAAVATNAVLGRQIHGPGAAVVAVIDTGVDPDHPFLRPFLVPGYDFLRESFGVPNELNDLPADQRALVNPTTTPLLMYDLFQVNPTTTPLLEKALRDALALRPLPIGFGHGTMVAGAVRLVSPGAKIMPLKAFNSAGSGRLFDVVRAIYHAESHGAKIVNMSLSATQPSLELSRAVEWVSAEGVICVASTGNDGLLTSTIYPAAIPWVTGVAALDPTHRVSSFSNFGVDLARVAAPGEGTLLPYPGGRWAGGWGTSFAAPLVSGTAALIVQFKPSATYSDLQSALSKSQPLGDPNLGHGLLDVASVVASVR